MNRYVLALLVIAALVAGCAQSEAPEPTADAGPPADEVLSTGTVVPARRAKLAFLTTGRLVWLGPQIGDQVAARQAVARLDDGQPRAQRSATLARVAAARAALIEAGTAVPRLEILAADNRLGALPGLEQGNPTRLFYCGERQTASFVEGAAFPATFAGKMPVPSDEARSAIPLGSASGVHLATEPNCAEVPDPTLAHAVAQYRQAVAELDAAEVALAEVTLLAPFTGTVTARLVNEGEVVPIGTPVLTIADLSQLQVETSDLAEGVVGRVQPGQRVDLTIAALDGRTVAGRVARVSPMPTGEQGATNYSATILLDRQEPGLRWGMTADIRIFAK